MDTLLLKLANPGYIPESESPYREFQHKATASTSKGLRSSCRTWKVLTRAHDWQPLTWLAGVETATAPLENRVTVPTNAAHRPTPGRCPSTPVCTQTQAHTCTKRQLNLHGFIITSPTAHNRLSINNRTRHYCSGYIMEYYLVMKKDKLLGQTTTWVTLREIMMKETKSTYSMMPLI